MTVAAYDAHPAFVRIIVRVAIVAPCFEFDLKYRLDVAFVAGNFLVRTVQQVIRVSVMIKKRFRPIVGAVTAFTFVTEVTVVLVVFQMAGDTGRFQRIGERVLAVTIIAGKLRMAAVQDEIGIPGMVKARIVP